MARVVATTMALSLVASTAFAQSTTTSAGGAAGSVVSVFVPIADNQPLVASLVGQGNNVQTLAITCPASITDCAFDTPMTLTAGASTVHVSYVEDIGTLIADCTLAGTTAGQCAETLIADAAYLSAFTYTGTDSNALPTATAGVVSTLVITTALGTSDITFFPVTITAGLSSAGSGSTAATATSTATAVVSMSTSAASGSSAAASANGWSDYSAPAVSPSSAVSSSTSSSGSTGTVSSGNSTYTAATASMGGSATSTSSGWGSTVSTYTGSADKVTFGLTAAIGGVIAVIAYIL